MLCVFKKLFSISDGWDMKNKETRALWIPGFSASCRRRGEVWGMLTEPLQWPPWASPGVPVLWEPFQCMVRMEMGLKWSFTPQEVCCCSKHSCQCHPTVAIQNQGAQNVRLYLLTLLLFLGNRSENIPEFQSTVQDWLCACISSKGWVFFFSQIIKCCLARNIPNTLLKCDQSSDYFLNKDLHILFKHEIILGGWMNCWKAAK